MPKISVIIPCYETAEALPACLESVLAQTYRDFEIVAVNDGSPDQCGEILAAYAQREPRLRVFTHENRGLSAARNTGLDHAHGEYLLFLDSDDQLPCYALEILLTIAQKYDVPVVVSRHFGALADPTHYTVTCHRDHLFESFVTDRKIFSSACNRLYHRDALQGLRFKEGILFEDWPFQTILFSKLSAYATTDLPCYIYVDDNTSTVRSAFTLKKAASYLQGIRYIHEVFKSSPLLRLAQKRMATAMKMLINKTYKSKLRDLQQYVSQACYELFDQEIVYRSDIPLKSRFRLWRMKP